ncbi:MAG: ribonuclease R [Rhodospirillales bacterium]|nr:ribonuclease R [Rhodospirillales bacterium]
MKFNQSDILEFIRAAGQPVTKREVARAFNVKGGENRIILKKALKALESEGIISKFPGGAYGVPDGLPSVGVIEVCEVDVDGDVFARPQDWNEELQGPAPRIEVRPGGKGHPAAKEGDRILARLQRIGDHYEARPIKILDNNVGRVLGQVRYHKHGPALIPTDKKAKYDFDINPGDLNGASEGDLVIGEILPSRAGLRRKKVKVVELVGKQGDPKAISIISLHEAGLREDWPDKVLKDAEELKVPSLKGREDLRGYPLVTIDGSDARDFDDAVFAKKLDDGGFHLIVAIADVAYYVRDGSALDTEARRRGNSTYFPDRVVPMLPEALSNDLCSLRPHEPRACMAVHLWIDEDGNLKKYKFVRGLMRSAARLVYEQVQAAQDGVVDDLTGPLIKTVIKPLYDAYAVLDKARQKRGALDLDLPEKQILINEQNEMTGVKIRERLDAHKLIEEFMILANVAAASALEDKKDPKRFPCVYRVHDTPSSEKLDSVREFIETFGLTLPKGQVTRPAQINGILRQAAKLPTSHLISTVILRSQSQAVYSAANIGHFGLALHKYAHFTSPIRRYADLLVHRSLIAAYGLGPGGISEGEIAQIDETCDHISNTERNSMVAERSAVDRFTASYLSGQIGAEFSGKISGVTRFGLFVTLDESGADGLVPMKSLAGDFYIHDEAQHALVGRRTGRVFRLGAPVTVRLREADGLTGSTVLELCEESVNGAEVPGVVFKARKLSRQDRGERAQKPQKHRGKPGGKQHSSTGKKGAAAKKGKKGKCNA